MDSEFSYFLDIIPPDMYFRTKATICLCGFVNAGHFAVAFKRSTKLSPSEYRKIYVQK